MIVSGQESYLNFCRNAIQCRLDHREVHVPKEYAASVHPRDCTSVSGATLLTARVVAKLFQAKDGPAISNESLQATHKILDQGLRADTFDLKDKRFVTKALTSIENFLVKNKPSDALSILVDKDPKLISDTELKHLEIELHQLVNDRSYFAKVVTHDTLEFIKDFIIICFERTGGKFKPHREKGYVDFDWEHIHNLTPEAIAISARLERARQEGKFQSELSLILLHAQHLDAPTLNTLTMWQYYCLLLWVGDIHSKFAKSIDAKPTSYTTVDPFVRQARALAHQKMFDVHYNRFQEHFTRTDVSFSYEACMDFLVEHLKNLSELVSNYYSTNPHINDLYEAGYTKYFKTGSLHAGYNSNPPPHPEEFNRLFVPTIDPFKIRQQIHEDPLFHEIEVWGQKGVCCVLAEIIAPANAAYREYLLDFLKIDLYRPLPEPHPFPGRSTNSPGPSTDASAGISKPKKQKARPKKPAKHHHKPRLELKSEISQLCEKVKEIRIEEAPPKGEPEKPQIVIQPEEVPAQIKPMEPPYRLAPPILKIAKRVDDWKNFMPTPDRQDAKDFHTYSFFITRLILAYVPEKPWVSQTTHKINRHFFCVGTFKRLGKDLHAITGFYGECLDGDLLWHHRFEPCPPHILIERFKVDETFFLDDEDQVLPSSQEVTPIIESSDCDFKVAVSPFSIKAYDTRHQRKHKLALFTF
jgi:hypothetical protein